MQSETNPAPGRTDPRISAGEFASALSLRARKRSGRELCGRPAFGRSPDSREAQRPAQEPRRRGDESGSPGEAYRNQPPAQNVPGRRVVVDADVEDVVRADPGVRDSWRVLPAYRKTADARSRFLENEDTALLQRFLERWQIRSKQLQLLLRTPLDASSEEDD